jgi:hypothetical protein
MLKVYDITFDNGRHTKVMAHDINVAVVYFTTFFDSQVDTIKEAVVQIIIEQFNLN